MSIDIDDEDSEEDGDDADPEIGNEQEIEMAMQPNPMRNGTLKMSKSGWNKH
jgi:hypothetical protein